MTREIKFRVRDRDTRKFIGYETLMPDITNDAWAWAKSYGGTDWERGVYESDYHLREQYTGLKDKNGKEIYESDICNDGSQVVFLGGRFLLIYTNGTHEDLIGDEDEIISNIYENPELVNNSK